MNEKIISSNFYFLFQNGIRMATAIVPEVKVSAEDDADGDADEHDPSIHSTTTGYHLALPINQEHIGIQLPSSNSSKFQGHRKLGRSPPLLAPPPRFSPEDEDDDHAWIDLVDSTTFLDCPNTLASYSSLRPRLSYR